MFDRLPVRDLFQSTPDLVNRENRQKSNTAT